MSCSCGYVQRWLMPCVHICSIIKDEQYLTSDLFHIRWWKHFDYIYIKGNSSMDEKTRHSLEMSLNEVRDVHFYSHNGKYKGVPLNGTSLLAHLQMLSNDDNASYNLEKDMMLSLNKMRSLDIPLKKGSSLYMIHMTDSSMIDHNMSKHYIDLKQDSFHDYETEINNESLEDDTNEYKDIIDSFAAGSQTESSLSQFRKNIPLNQQINYSLSQDSIDINTSNQVIPYYSQLKPLFEEMVSSIKSQDDCDDCKDAIEKLTYSLLNKKRNHVTMSSDTSNKQVHESSSSDQMSFLGEHTKGSKRVVSRTQYKFERFSNMKKKRK